LNEEQGQDEQIQCDKDQRGSVKMKWWAGRRALGRYNALLIPFPRCLARGKQRIGPRLDVAAAQSLDVSLPVVRFLNP
jgi:hypothetical protein